jgi:hypothetical protein
MNLRNMARKLLAATALLALVTASMPALAESLSASDSPACCNTSYCPVHHRQGRDIQKDRSNCDTAGKPALPDCSMRACDPAPNQAVGTAPFVLIAPAAIFYEATAQAAPLTLSLFFPFALSIPSTPPPRTLLS